MVEETVGLSAIQRKEITMTTMRRERTVWVSVLLWLSLAGLIGAIAWGFFSYGALQDRLANLPRAAVPGQVTVDVPEPQTLTIFYEDPTADGTFVVQTSGSNTITVSPVELTVTAPSGEEVAIAPYERDLRFDYDGRVLTAMATIDASTVGTYTVEASGDTPPSAQISVGHVVDVGLIAHAVGVIGLFLASLAGVATAGVLIAVRRRRVESSDESERPLVGV
jgi:hypothetical protein